MILPREKDHWKRKSRTCVPFNMNALMLSYLSLKLKGQKALKQNRQEWHLCIPKFSKWTQKVVRMSDECERKYNLPQSIQQQ